MKVGRSFFYPLPNTTGTVFPINCQNEKKGPRGFWGLMKNPRIGFRGEAVANAFAPEQKGKKEKNMGKKVV
ncbi:MAG: hypothetical protein CM15mP78_06950 [Candidatus Poseidoniales archaeon]|nr:MAG: hypothetical protein CM15mP78_06950 [Candidatus Poseidoniales archaeon]